MRTWLILSLTFLAHDNVNIVSSLVAPCNNLKRRNSYTSSHDICLYSLKHDREEDCDNDGSSRGNGLEGENDSARRKLLLQSSAGILGSTLLMDNDEGSIGNNLLGGQLKLGVAAANAGTLVDASEARRIRVFEQTAPSVVFIDIFAERRDAFSTNIMEVPLGTGSGFIWDNQGHIVTNFHVVRNANSAQVAILTPNKNKSSTGQITGEPTASSKDSSSSSGGEINPYTSMKPSNRYGGDNVGMSTYKAKVVGVDPTKDIAILKVEAPKSELTPIPVGTSIGLKVGQQALAIGNPFGLDHTLTAGIISGTGREVKSPIGRPINNVIQTDAAINPGNSGGPLLDIDGRLIGMNTAIFSPTGASAGVGFAIPVDTVKLIADTLIRDGQIVRPVLGISYLESKQARALGIGNGVLILEVPPNSPASKAGLRGTGRTESGLIEIGDVITQIGKRKIETETDLFKALDDCKPGDKVDLSVLRVTPSPATGDGLTLAEVTLEVELQPSTIYDKNFNIEKNKKIYEDQ